MYNPTSSKRPSKSVVERKKVARRIKYNAIGVVRQQAIIASANVIQCADGEDIDMTDVFDFMTWYLSNIEETANAQGPVPESIVIQFRDNLVTLDLTGNCRKEKVEFVMDLVRAPELKQVCTSLLKVDTDAIDAVTEVPLIDLSDTVCGTEAGELSASSVDQETSSIGTTAPVHEYTEYVEETVLGDITAFTDLAIRCGTCPILTFDESWKNHNNVLSGQSGFQKSTHYVVTWSLPDFRRIFISDEDYDTWLYNLYEERSPQNVRWKSNTNHSQHYFKQLFARLVDIPLSLRYEAVGFLMVSSGLTIITTGERGCSFIRV